MLVNPFHGHLNKKPPLSQKDKDLVKKKPCICCWCLPNACVLCFNFDTFFCVFVHQKWLTMISFQAPCRELDASKIHVLLAHFGSGRYFSRVVGSRFAKISGDLLNIEVTKATQDSC